MRLRITFCLLNLTAYALGSNVVRTDGEDIGIHIVGTIANTSTSASVALLKDKESGRVLAVKKGVRILDRYEVAEVRPKYILLQQDENYWIVYQSKFAGEFQRTVETPKVQPSYQEPGFERRDGKIRITEEFRDRLVKKDLSQILMQASAIPYMDNGKIIGFQLLQIDAGSIYDKAGLLDEDIVTSINDKELGSVAGAINLLNSLRQETRVEMIVLRNGKPQTVVIDVQ